MPARVFSAALVGVEAVLVRVEVDVASGLPAFTTVGLPDLAVRESRERVRTAIRNAGFGVLSDRITVNLAPADIRKEGASFDLPIALGILAATGVVNGNRFGPCAVVGELALDGQIQPVRGVLAVGLACRRRGVGTLLVPSANRREAAMVGGLNVLAADTLREAVGLLNGEEPAPRPALPAPPERVPEELDLTDVRGQAHAKRALEIAAAGTHNVLLIGPPGGGQTVYIGQPAGRRSRIPLELLTSVALLWLPDTPDHPGRRLALRSRLPLESSAPVSVRWLHENQGKLRCQCGCGEVLRLQPRAYWRTPRYVHGHHNRRGHWQVLQLRQAGYLTVSDVAKALRIGTTTLRRREGVVYPRAARIGGIRVYHEADVDLLRSRDKTSRVAGGK